MSPECDIGHVEVIRMLTMTQKKKPRPTPTKMVRVQSDLADMLSAIIEVDGEAISDILDPLIRPQITARYANVKERYEAIQKLKNKGNEEE